MKTDLSHIPEEKANFLRKVSDLIVKEAAKTCEEIAFVILFGSYARGDWVHCYPEPGDKVAPSISDYDIMVIPKNACENKLTMWHKIEKKISKIKRIENFTPEGLLIPEPTVSLFYHNIKFFNEQLKENEFFYADVKKEGIILYDSGKYELAESKSFTPLERQAKARENFEDYLLYVEGFLSGVQFYMSINNLHLAAFSLHQATENLFSTISLVYVDYKEKTHDLAELRIYAGRMDSRFLDPFPIEEGEPKRLFKLLRRAYIEARYKRRTYIITKEDLEQLYKQVLHLKKLAEELCEEKIVSFAGDQDE